jgi:hypothetical protein
MQERHARIREFEHPALNALKKSHANRKRAIRPARQDAREWSVNFVSPTRAARALSRNGT